jgi:hypothetical protein
MQHPKKPYQNDSHGGDARQSSSRQKARRAIIEEWSNAPLFSLPRGKIGWWDLLSSFLIGMTVEIVIWGSITLLAFLYCVMNP